MNKRSIRAFSLGIIFTVSVIGSYYFYFDNSLKLPNSSQAKNLLEEKGYTVLTKTEYQKLRGKIISTNKQQTKQSKAQKKILSKNQTIRQENNNTAYLLQVVAGMPSGEIANLLAEQNIIENANEFQQYLITHQYETKVQLGTYNLTNKMDYEQIAKIITKSK
jgi:hypothetical protein